MKELRKKNFDQGNDNQLRCSYRQAYKNYRQRTNAEFSISESRHPKYGFPLDVIELDTHPVDGQPTDVALQRDLSQAIAEYAPGGKVIANKLEWESCGVKEVAGKTWPVRQYKYDDTHNFTQAARSPHILRREIRYRRAQDRFCPAVREAAMLLPLSARAESRSHFQASLPPNPTQAALRFGYI